MSKLKFFVVSFIAVLLFSTLSVTSIQAQTTNNFDVTVSPVFFDFTTKPGGTVNGSIRLRNNTSSPLPVKVEIKKLGGDQNGDLTIQNKQDETIGWFKIENKSITTPPTEWINVPFTITAPDNAAYGYYWALSFTQDSQTEKAVTGAKVNASIVVPVLLNVSKSGAKTDGKISEFKTDSSWYEYLPVNFNTTFSNAGNVHVRPAGNIFIKDWMGRTVATLDVNPNQGAVLPGTKKTFLTEWKDSFIWYENKAENGKAVLDKNGKPIRELKVRFDKILDIRIGKYTATSLVVINDGKRDIALEKSISFVVFPWKIAIGSLVFVLFALLGIISTTKTIGIRVMKLFRRGK